jgi:endonuclease-3
MQNQVLKIKALAINRALKKLHPDARIALTFKNNFELLVAVILSAQCTDKKVNQITPQLFKKYRTVRAYAAASPRDMEALVHSCGFYRAKTKNIIGAAKYLLAHHKGQVPKTMKEILHVPGVARKTGNVVLGNAYGVVEGIAVDTHVIRLSRLFRLTKHHDPVKIESDLMTLLPKKKWFPFTYRLINYGRTHCTARCKHEVCPLRKYIV